RADLRNEIALERVQADLDPDVHDARPGLETCGRVLHARSASCGYDRVGGLELTARANPNGRGTMTRKIQVHQVDAFTRERFTGNPAGVVLNADGLSEAQMLAIARELNNADTAFILAPDNSEYGMRARFFTPRTEVGFVGHATVAAHYVLSRRHSAPRQVRQKSKAGVVDIEVRGLEEDRSIAIRQTMPLMARDLNDRERFAGFHAQS